MESDGRAVIVHLVHSLDGGGTERTLLALLRALDPRRLRHVVVTLRSAGRLSARLPDHVSCHALRATGRSRLTGLALARVVRTWGAGLIHARNTCCWGDALMASALLPGTRLALSFHGLESATPFSAWQRFVARVAQRAGADFTAVSESGVNKLCDEAGVQRHRVALLRNGVERAAWTPLTTKERNEARAGLGLEENAFVVGTVGSLTPVKRHAVLIGAMARVLEAVPSSRLLIVGDGPLRADLMRHADEVGVARQIVLTGWREDVRGLLGCMDAYVCNSASEGMNNALLEALAVGIPSVVTDVGDNARVIRDGVDGLVIAPEAGGPLEDALVRLGTQGALRRRLGEAARARAGDFDFDGTVRAYEAYYRDSLPTLTEARPAGRPAAVPAPYG